jgi:hypothetical protein
MHHPQVWWRAEIMDGIPETLCRYFYNGHLWFCCWYHKSRCAYKVVIEGHADEISWYVNYITDDGLI